MSATPAATTANAAAMKPRVARDARNARVVSSRSVTAHSLHRVIDAHQLAVARAAKGFMPEGEGLALYEAGSAAGARGPLLEVGTYCGKSAVYLGAAARECGSVLFTVDHHRGSEENQAGWEHHDP